MAIKDKVKVIQCVLVGLLCLCNIIAGEINLKWCSKHCKCLNNYKTADCTWKSLTQVPELSNLTANLYLENNNITALNSDSFEDMDNLRIIKLLNNGLQSVSSEHFQGLQNLQILDLSGNKLLSFIIPNDTSLDYQLPALESLILSDNKLSEIPKNLGLLAPRLKTLNISFNKLESVLFAVDSNVTQLESLRYLDLRGNLIHRIAADDLVSLRGIPLLQLSLSGNRMVSIEADAFKGMTELQVLSLSHNLLGQMNLVSVFTAIGNSSHMAELDLSEMYLPNITVALLGMFNQLTNLDIRDSSIRFIEPELFDTFTELETLNAGHNDLLEVTNLEAMKKLRRLHLDSNKLTANLNLTKLEKLEIVDVSNNDIEVLPPNWLGHKENLQVLNMSHNKITSVHVETFSGLSLQLLDLSHNQLRILDKTGLKRLPKLDVSNNELTIVTPEAFTDLVTTLQDMDLSHNNLSCFPLFPEFISLQELNLASNNLGQALNGGMLANLFHSMGLLQKLDLSANFITMVAPGQLQSLHHLTTLGLSNNKICRITDAAVAEIGAVSRLVMANNGMIAIDTDILDKLENLQEVDFSDNPFDCTPCQALPFLRWMNRTLVMVLDRTDHNKYLCNSPPDLSGQYLLDYHPFVDDKICIGYDLPRTKLDWAMIGVAIVGMAVFLTLAGVLFFYTQLCHKIKSLHYRWQIRYREVSGVEFTNEVKA